VNTKPGADELRIARLLRQRGVGPDAEPRPAVLPQPADADELRIRFYLCRMGVVL